MNLVKTINEPPKVLHVLDQLTHNSGVARVVINYIKGCSPGYFCQSVAVHQQVDPQLEEIVRQHGGQVFRLSPITKKITRDYRKDFRILLKEQSFSIIHGHMLNSAFLYLSVAKSMGVPVRIIHSHNPKTSDILWKEFRNSFLNIGIPRWANGYVATNRASAKPFGQMAGNTIILPNSIDVEQFEFCPKIRKTMRDRLGIDRSTVCIGHVGRFFAQKNHLFLIQAFMEYHQRVPNSVLVLVGNGPLWKRVKNQVQAARLEKVVYMVGSQEEIAPWYQMFDQFWMPSLFEGWGLVALEAQASGLPCLLSEEVPLEVGVSLDCHYLPIKQVSVWSQVAQSIKFQKERLSGSENINRAGFNLVAQNERLINLYRFFLKK